MSLNESMTELMDRLAMWSGFPKYQLERRVDIFLTPFLAPWIGRCLDAEATLVAPEFPILASLGKEAPPPYGHKDWTAHTVNADYLVHVERRRGARSWLLVELKTDGHSYRDAQHCLYWNALDRPMSKLRADLKLVREHTETRHKPKYDALEHALERFDDRPTEVIELAYLGPGASRAISPDCARKAAPSDPRRDRVHLLSLEALVTAPDEWVPERHRELWIHVRSLLQRIAPATRVGDAR